MERKLIYHQKSVIKHRNGKIIYIVLRDVHEYLNTLYSTFDT